LFFSCFRPESLSPIFPEIYGFALPSSSRCVLRRSLVLLCEEGEIGGFLKAFFFPPMCLIRVPYSSVEYFELCL